MGARSGALGRWEALDEQVHIVGFEPDPEECARLAAGAPAHVRYLPLGLAEAEGTRDLHVTRNPACSSLHAPVAALVAHYPALGGFAVERVEAIRCRRLDDVLAEEGIGPVAAIKLDTQGSELAILRGAPDALATCALVDIEVEFNPLYEGQDLFCDVDRFLRDRGFALWRLERLEHYGTRAKLEAHSILTVVSAPLGELEVPVRVADGQLFSAQAHYVRASFPRAGADGMAAAESIPAAASAGLYGHWDLALELVRKTGDAPLLAALEAAVQPAPVPGLPPAPVPAPRRGPVRALLNRLERRARRGLRGRRGR